MGLLFIPFQTGTHNLRSASVSRHSAQPTANPFLVRKPLQNRPRISFRSKNCSSNRCCSTRACAAGLEGQSRDGIPSSSSDASTSDRCKNSKERINTDPMLAAGLLSLFDQMEPPDPAQFVKDRIGRKLADRVFYDEVLPPVGSLEMSYARFLDLLEQRLVRRIHILADGNVALVEVPVEGFGFDTTRIKTDRYDDQVEYATPVPEWFTEKNTFYVSLPGDLWEEGEMMRLIKQNLPQRTADNHIPYENMLQMGQFRPELSMVDQTGKVLYIKDYVGWLLPMAQILTVQALLFLGRRLLMAIGFLKPKPKDDKEKQIELMGKHKAEAYNVGKGSEKKDTGVRFKDVAGIDRVKDSINEVMRMMLGAPEYKKLGITTPRGILMEGPPGTGKTYMARAMAGEAGLPFYSANGAEFVEVYEGVAATRMASLFKDARENAPSIIFIDEMDAIGAARGAGGGSEREQGLLQLLTEMDGFVRDDKVLVIGATNRIDVLDPALLRHGRFDRHIYMGLPSTPNRLEILKVHAEGKAIDRSNDDALLKQVAELTVGYSGADLANLLNEAAIFMVREDTSTILISQFVRCIDRFVYGLPSIPMPSSIAKTRKATVLIGRALVTALTPGLPPIDRVNNFPRGGRYDGRLEFQEREVMNDISIKPLSYVEEFNGQTSQPHMANFSSCCHLVIPLYASRATEELFYGPEGVTLATSNDVCEAGMLATYLVETLNLHPAFMDEPPVIKSQWFYPDPAMEGRFQDRYEDLTVRIQKAAWAQAKRLIRLYKDTIQKLAQEMLTNPLEAISGPRLVEAINEANIPASEIPSNRWYWSEGEGDADAIEQDSGVSFDTSQYDSENFGKVGSISIRTPPAPRDPFQELLTSPEPIRQAAEVVLGRLDIGSLISDPGLRQRAENVKKNLEDDEIVQRLRSMRNYVLDADAPFPFAPPEVYYNPFDAVGMDDFVEEADEITVFAADES